MDDVGIRIITKGKGFSSMNEEQLFDEAVANLKERGASDMQAYYFLAKRFEDFNDQGQKRKGASMSKAEDIKEMVEIVTMIGGVVESLLDTVEGKKDVVKRAAGIFMDFIHGLNEAELEHEGYFQGVAKTKAALIAAYEAEGFTREEAILFSLDRELKLKSILRKWEGAVRSKKDD